MDLVLFLPILPVLPRKRSQHTAHFTRSIDSSNLADKGLISTRQHLHLRCLPFDDADNELEMLPWTSTSRFTWLSVVV